MVHNGFDPKFWLDEQVIPKKIPIITVANVKTLRNYYLKGIDSFIELARTLPEYTFKIIGLNKEFLSNGMPIRLKFPVILKSLNL